GPGRFDGGDQRSFLRHRPLECLQDSSLTSGPACFGQHDIDKCVVRVSSLITSKHVCKLAAHRVLNFIKCSQALDGAGHCSCSWVSVAGSHGNIMSPLRDDKRLPLQMKCGES